MGRKDPLVLNKLAGTKSNAGVWVAPGKDFIKIKFDTAVSGVKNMGMVGLIAKKFGVRHPRPGTAGSFGIENGNGGCKGLGIGESHI
ncbi:conserved hypothetical protein [Ricinus communis]|uniref:Uncharacterized protein n=1 Tax=Ricinus communis TaxID=3988 RepID=B9RKZ2_RICCO|nr:conserved hypothetical protein [Ricinus communis]